MNSYPQQPPLNQNPSNPETQQTTMSLIKKVKSLSCRVSDVRTALDRGDDVNARTPIGWTALIYAAKKGRTEIARMLIGFGADVNARTDEGCTALIAAAREGRTEIVRMLIGRGADVNARDDDGCTALIDAAFHGYTKFAPILIGFGALHRIDVKRMLHDDADVNVRAETVRLLLDHGADVNARTDDGWTALIAAATRGNAETVRLLLDRGAELWSLKRETYSEEINIVVEEYIKKRAAIIIQKYVRRFLVLEKVTNPTHEWGYNLLMARFKRYSEESF